MKLLFFIAMVVQPVFVQPEPRVDVVGQINAYVASVEPEGEPAWPLYRDAIVSVFGLPVEGERYPANDHPVLEAIRYFPSDGDWEDPRWDLARQALRRHAAALGLMKPAANRPRLGRPYVRVGSALTGERAPEAVSWPFVSHDDLLAWRPLAELTILSMRDASGRADWVEFARRTEAVVGLGRHLLASGSVIDRLIAANVLSTTMKEVRFALLEKQIPAESAGRLAEILSVDVTDGFVHAIEIERLQLLGLVEALHDENGYVAVWATEEFPLLSADELAKPTLSERLMNVRALWRPRLWQAREIVESRFGELREWAMGFELRHAEDAMRCFPKEPTGFSIIDEVMPAYRRAALHQAGLQREVEATRIMLGLEAHHARTGEWPESAEELTPLNDPLIRDESLRYQRRPDGYSLSAAQPLWALELYPLMEFPTDFTAPRPPFWDDEE